MFSSRILSSRGVVFGKGINKFHWNRFVVELSSIATLIQESQAQAFTEKRFLLVQCSRTISNSTSLFRKVQKDKDFSSSKVKGEDDEIMVKGDKILNIKLKSTRLDGVLKDGLQISKNKIEKAFYEDRIRLNGERPRKKSLLMNEGDEIDFIRQRNNLNPEFLDISRVEIVKIGSHSSQDDDDDDDREEDDPDDFRIAAVLKRYKSLTIQNYSRQPYKGTGEEE